MKTMADQNEAENKRPLRSTHKTPFAWQAMSATRLIRKNYQGERRTTAIAIYQSFTECASEQGRLIGQPTAIFYVPHKRLADKSGKSVSTIKRYANEFKHLGILGWKIQKQGKTNKQNKWALFATPIHNGELPSLHNNGLNTLVHNSELGMQEPKEDYINKKDQSKDWRNGNGMRSIGDILGKRPRL